MAPASARRRRPAGRLPPLLAAAWLLPSAARAAVPARQGHGASGRAAAAGRGGAAKEGSGASLTSLLEPAGDHTLDPRGADYRPRPGPGEDGHDAWAFGKAHAALHHVLESAPAGEPRAALSALEAFSAKHGLSFGLGSEGGALLASTVGDAMAAAAASRPEGQGEAPSPGLNVLALRPGLGAPLLHCLPTLLGLTGGLRGGGPALVHELVSVQGDDQLSSGGARLVAHALGEGELQERVRHTPLVADEETSLAEVLETLREGYELPAFDVVILEVGPRGRQREQLDALLAASALREGAVVHAEGPAEGEEGAEGLAEALRRGTSGTPRFDAQVRGAGPGRAAVVASYRGRAGSSEL